MKIIAITNQKGGVGKTTTAINIACVLAKKKYRTLLIDTDPQCNSTATFHAKTEGIETMYDIMTGDATANEAVQHLQYCDIIPSDELLSNADIEFNKPEHNIRLKNAIETISQQYDYIIIDTPPYIGTMLITVLTAATDIIIPVMSGLYSIQGLGKLSLLIKQIQKTTNPRLNVMGILFTSQQNNTIVDKAMQNLKPQLEDIFETKVFSNTIRSTIKVKEAEANGIPLLHYAPYSPAGIDYQLLCKEIREA